MEPKNSFPQGRTWPTSAEKKGYSSDLRYADRAPYVWHALKNLPRTGWVDRGVKNPESVAEHITSLRKLILDNREQFKEFNDEEIQDLLDMLEVHDWAESKPEIGDQVIIWKDEEEKKRLKEEKFKQEYEGMTDICRNLGKDGERIFSLWLRYAEKKDPIALFAKQADKYQAMEKAFEYESRGEKVSTMEFIKHDEDIIQHPFFIKKVAELKKKVESLKESVISWPTEEVREENEGFNIEQEYFNIELEFAKTVAEKTGKNLEDVLLEYTDFHRKFGLGPPDKDNLIWKGYVEKLKEGEDPIALTKLLHVYRQIQPKPPGFEFGYTNFNINNGVVDIHFINKGKGTVSPFSTEQLEKRKDELKQMFQLIKDNYPDAKKVIAESWLLNISSLQKLVPEKFTQSIHPSRAKFYEGSLWGQFLDRTGKVRPEVRQKFLDNLKNLDMADPSKIFPSQVLQASCDIEDFYKLYGIENKEKPAFLWHGTNSSNVDTLTPQKRYTPGGENVPGKVYASDLPAFSAAHSFPWSSDEGINLWINDGKDVVLEVPEKFKERLMQKVYMYKVPSGKFSLTASETTGHTYDSLEEEKSVEVLEFSSVQKAVEYFGGKVVYLNEGK